jgi:hypothetical protein
MTYFALNVQRCLVLDDQLQALVLVPDDQVLVLVPDDHQALLLVPDDQQGLVLHKKQEKGKCYGQRTNCIVTHVNYYLCKCGHGVVLGILPR